MKGEGMKNYRTVYEVPVEIRLKAKITTAAYSEEEAGNNVMFDYENSSLADFLSNYDFEVTSFDMDYPEIKDEPW